MPLRPWFFQLTVDDGQGATSSDTVNVAVTVTPQLFIANFAAAANSVVSFANPASTNGNIAPTTNLSGAQTGLTSPADVVVDAAGSLLVANLGGFSITAYSVAATANGNFAPVRNLQGAATGLVAGTGTPATLAIDKAADRLFVGRIGGFACGASLCQCVEPHGQHRSPLASSPQGA